MNGNHLVVSIGAGVVQRHEASFVLRVDIGASLQQKADDAAAVVARRQMEGRRPAAIARMAIHVEWGQQRRQTFFISRAGCLQQFILKQQPQNVQLVDTRTAGGP